MRLAYFISFFVAVTAHALLVADTHDTGGFHVSQIREAFDAFPYLDELQPHALEKRNSRSKCKPWFVDVNPTGEARQDDLQERNFTLHKRVMTLPQGDMTRFFRNELTDPDLNPIIWNVQTRTGLDATNTADYSDFGDVAISYGTKGLCGCTVLAVFSKRGLYVAHYWENIVFDPDQDYLNIYGSKDKVFEKLVIKGLSEGIGRGKNIAQVSLKNQAARIDDESVHALLMIPQKTWDDKEDGYRNRWNEIKSKVGDFIPALKPSLNEQGQETNLKWTEYRYNAIEEEDSRAHQNTPTGKILIKYDPDHNEKKKISIWIEDNIEPIFNLEW